MGRHMHGDEEPAQPETPSLLLLLLAVLHGALAADNPEQPLTFCKPLRGSLPHVFVHFRLWRAARRVTNVEVFWTEKRPCGKSGPHTSSNLCIR